MRDDVDLLAVIFVVLPTPRGQMEFGIEFDVFPVLKMVSFFHIARNDQRT